MTHNRFESEGAWYTYTLMDMLEAIKLYGWNQVIQDLSDMHNAELAKVLSKNLEGNYTEFGGNYE